MNRVLGNLFAIKPNEWQAVWYFFLIIALFSFGSSIARSIAMTLIMKHPSGKELLPQIFIMIDLSAMLGFIAYAHYTKKVNGLTILTLFLTGTMIFTLVAWLLFFLPSEWEQWFHAFFAVGFFFFYILISVHISSVVGAYFTSVQFKRVTGFINAGFPIGGALGGAALMFLLEYTENPESLIPMLALAAFASLLMTRQVHAKLSPVRPGHSQTRSSKTPFQEFSAAFHYIIHSKLMIYMSLGLILFVLSNKFMEYQYQALIYPEAFPDDTDRATFFAMYEIVANLAWFLIQLFFTGRIIMKIGVGASNIIHPILMAIVSLGLLFKFGFIAGFYAHFVNQEMRGAMRTPANNLLFNAIPPNMWGITKAFLNGIVFPLATTVAGISLMILKGHLSTDTLTFVLPLMTLTLALLGIIVALPQWAAYNEGVFGLLNRTLFTRETSMDKKNYNLNTAIQEKLDSDDPQDVIAALGMIRVLKLKNFIHPVGKLLRRSEDFTVKQHCVDTLAVLPGSDAAMTHLVNALRNERNPQTLALILKNLAQFRSSDPDLLQVVEKLLLHPSPPVFTEACLCLYNNAAYPYKTEIEVLLLKRLQRPDLPEFALYLQALGELRQPRYSEMVIPFLDHPQADIALAAFTSHIRMLEGRLDPYKPRFITALESPNKEMKIAALRALKECSPPEDWNPVIRMLGAKDRAIINECKELLRLSLSASKPALVESVFSRKISVDEKFEILSLIYPKLNHEQKRRLRADGDRNLQAFLFTLGLLMIYRKEAADDKVDAIVEKVLEEIADNYLLSTLTAVTYLSNENREFFDRVSRGLQSGSRAIQGNTLEVLSNVPERHLVDRLLKYYDERPADLESLERLHEILFETPLGLNPENYLHYLLELEHDLLKACLYYARKADPREDVGDVAPIQALLGIK